MATSAHNLFLTGATGFVGGALVLELLRAHRGDRAFCLVRGSDDGEATRRLHDCLRKAADAYAVSDADLDDVIGRVVAVRGDVTRPGLGLSPGALHALAGDAPFTVWHSAASLKDTEEALGEIVLHNVTGTENLLETLLPLGVRTFNHVSTAYVAGRKNGLIAESLQRPRGFNNRYEQSKHYGEQLVVDHCWRAGVPWRILRPGIVVAHSVTGRATGYTGYLGWVLKLAALDHASGGTLRRNRLRYVGRPDAQLNVIPIDSVVEDCAGIHAAGAATENRVFHLTNGAPPTLQWLCRQSAVTLGLMPMELVPEGSDLDPVSARFHRWTRFERPYSLGDKQFIRAESNPLYPSPRHGVCPIDERLMRTMVLEAVADFRRQSAAGAGAA